MSKQLKLNELKRVVDVDKFAKYASILKDTSNHNERQIESILAELDMKTPSRDVLLKTRLGFLLKEISTRETLSKAVREQAKQLRLKWKEFHKRLLLAPSYDVKCDKPTTENRQKARQSLSNAFLRSNPIVSKTASTSDTHQVEFKPECEYSTSLIADLEFNLFQHCEKLVNQKYFSKCRQAIKLIADNANARNRFLSGEINSAQLIEKFLPDFRLLRNISASGSNVVEYFDDDQDVAHFK